MIFKRRDSIGLWSRVRAFVSPAKGWRRGFSYIGRRMQRLPDTPHRIALGFACGVMASFTPLFTLHFVVGALLALLVRGNVLASALGTFFGNPLTFPVIAFFALSLGNRILGHGFDPEKFHVGIVFSNFDKFLDTVFWPYLVGGIAPGLLTSVVIYVLVRPVIGAYQKRRRLKLISAAKARVEAHIRRSAERRAAAARDAATGDTAARDPAE